MPAKITEVSALVPLVQWMAIQGRPPTTKECRPENSLCHYSTYMRHFQTLSAAISAAMDFSGMGVSALQALCSPHQKPCIGCGELIPDEGRHIRHCRVCRKRLFKIDREITHIPGFLPEPLCREIWCERTWEEILEEATYLCH